MEIISKRVGGTYCMLIALCVSCILIAPIQASADLSGIEVVPSTPTANDIVTIHVSGEFSDGCWGLGPYQCGAVEGFLISPTVHAFDGWQPGRVCPMIVVPYRFSCEYGSLEVGHYVVTATEEHQSLRDPFPDVFSVEFDVVVPPAVEAAVDVDPSTLNLGSKGKYVTCYVELPGGYDPEEINVNTVLFNHAVDAAPSPTGVGDHDLNGILDRMIKFPRSEVIALFDGPDASYTSGARRATKAVLGSHGDDFEVTVSGELADGTPFVGTDVIGVINPRHGPDDSPDLRVSSTPPRTTALISFELDVGGFVNVLVYDATGRAVRTLVNEHKTSGGHDVMWHGKTDDGQLVSAGVYFVRLEHQGKTRVEKVLMLK